MMHHWLSHGWDCKVSFLPMSSTPFLLHHPESLLLVFLSIKHHWTTDILPSGTHERALGFTKVPKRLAPGLSVTLMVVMLESTTPFPHEESLT